jgi:hypothetical protein
MKLPFLKQKSWPRVAAPMEEKSYADGGEVGPDEDELLTQVAGEFMRAIKADDPKMLLEALKALVMNIQAQDETQDESMEDANAVS